MLGLLDTEIPARKYPLFAPNGIRVLGRQHDPVAPCYLSTDSQTGRRRLLPLCQSPTGPDAGA